MAGAWLEGMAAPAPVARLSMGDMPTPSGRLTATGRLAS